MTFNEPKKFVLPWRPQDPCPCDSGETFEYCCLLITGQAVIKTQNIIPNPKSGYRNLRCYLGRTENCSESISREHFISAAILRQLEGGIKVSGLPWQNAGAEEQYPINALASKILCERHNNALAPLDHAAGHFFSKVNAAMLHASMRSMVRKTEHYLVNGDGIERWAVKTALGLYHSRVARAGGECLADTHRINEDNAMALLSNQPLSSPLGIYMTKETGSVVSNHFNVAPLIHLESRTLCGLKIQMAGVGLGFVFDVSGGDKNFFKGGADYRVTRLDIKGTKRSSEVMLTWPEMGLLGRSLEIRVAPAKIAG